MGEIDRIVRRSGISHEIRTLEEMKQMAAVKKVVTLKGLDRRAVVPFLPPLVIRWPSGDTSYAPVAQSGIIVMYRAFAVTPPTSGTCLLTLTMYTESGIETIGTLEIPKNQPIGEQAFSYEVPASAWLRSTITTPNGAATVSSAITVKVV